MPINHTSKYSQLTDEQFNLIGKIVVEWANVEVLLGELLSRLLFTPDFLGRVYSDAMSAHEIQEALLKALEIHRYRYGNQIISFKAMEEIKKINAEIKELRSFRNKISHFCWSRSSDGSICGTSASGHIPTKKREEKDFITMSVQRLNKYCVDTYNIVERLSDITNKLPKVAEQTIAKLYYDVEQD